jgi:hypothetical protein
MNAPDNQTPAQMNWVDYCDSLANANFALRMNMRPPPFDPRNIPDHIAFVESVREAVRELK